MSDSTCPPAAVSHHMFYHCCHLSLSGRDSLHYIVSSKDSLHSLKTLGFSQDIVQSICEHGASHCHSHVTVHQSILLSYHPNPTMAMEKLVDVAAKASHAYDLLAGSAAPILRYGSLEQAGKCNSDSAPNRRMKQKDETLVSASAPCRFTTVSQVQNYHRAMATLQEITREPTQETRAIVV